MKFKDAKSFVYPDGRLWLVGKDWDDQRFNLLKRSHGQCENIVKGQRCKYPCADPHHKILRSIERDDRLSNLLAVCRNCHWELDKKQREARRH